MTLNSQIFDIVIYPHSSFDQGDGGITVQYYLAKCLKEIGHNVKICDNHGRVQNEIFNDFISPCEVGDQNIIFYCEGVIGNPLKKRKVVRWMLSELGQNVKYKILRTWGRNELIYFYGSEVRFKNKPHFIGTVYKTLNVIFTHPIFFDKSTYPNSRSGWCHTFRKARVLHKSITYLHPKDSKEITSNSFNELADIFKKAEYFISYDSITYLNTLAALCGCISIVYPLAGCGKESWLRKTHMWDYLVAHNLSTNIYGIAYGMEEIDYARQTLPLVHDQQLAINDFIKKRSLSMLENDLKNFELAQNIIENVYWQPINHVSIKPDEVQTCIFGMRDKTADITNIFINLLKSGTNTITVSSKTFGVDPYKKQVKKITILKKTGDSLEFYENEILLLS